MNKKLLLFKFSLSLVLLDCTNQGSDGEIQEAGGMSGEEKGEGEKSQKGGQQNDSLPFLVRLLRGRGHILWKLTFDKIHLMHCHLT